MSEVKDYYQHYWSPAGFDPEGPMDRAVWDLLEQHIGPQTRCVDIGCGDGRTYARWVAGLAASYAGFDISENAVERARAAGLAAAVIEDAGTLPAPDRSADVAICNEVLEHLFDPLNAAREVQRVLAPGGTLICTTPNVAYWRRRVDLAVLGRWNPLGDDRSVAEPWRDPHLRFFTPSTLRSMLNAAGFENVRIGGHAGAVLRDLPGLRVLRRGDIASHRFKRLEARHPALLGYALHATAQSPT